MKLFLSATLFAFVAFTGCGYGQPKLEIEGGDAYNWGKVSGKDGALKASIHFSNKGDKDLEISGVKPGCGCTTPSWVTKTIKPGETVDLGIGLNIGASTGDIIKNLTITSNDPAQPTKVYYLKATIQRMLTATPAYFAFNELEVGKEATANVKITNSSDSDINLTDIAASGVTLSIGKTAIVKAHSDLDVVAKFTPKIAGPVSMSVSMKTSHPEYPTFDISGYAQVKEPAGNVVNPNAQPALKK